MKKSLPNIIALSLISILLANCGGSKPVAQKKAVANADTIHAFNQNELGTLPSSRKDKFPFLKDSDAETKWVDSVYSSMTFDERVGQLFMVAAYSNKDSVHFNAVDKLIRDQKSVA